MLTASFTCYYKASNNLCGHSQSSRHRTVIGVSIMAMSQHNGHLRRPESLVRHVSYNKFCMFLQAFVDIKDGLSSVKI